MRRALLLLLGVLLLAGCGGGQSVGSPLGEAAEVAPASARVFLVLRTDAEADQTRAALALLERFPAIREHELQLENDILPALGDEAAIVVLRGGATILLARPADRDKLDALLARTETRTVTREIGGWTVVAEGQEELDTFEQEREAGTLTDDDAFRAEFDALPDDALAKAWSEQQDLFPGITAAVFADEDGLRFEGSVRGGADTDVTPFEPRLLDRVPAGASLVASFQGPEGLAERLRSLPIPPGLGLDELGGLLEGEGVVYVRTAALIPEATLLTEVDDEEAAEAAVSQLLGRLGVSVRPGEQGRGGRVTLGPVTISYGARDGVLAVTTASLDVVLEPAADGLADDPRFVEAVERAELPDESGGFLYVRIDDLVPLLTMLAGAQGVDLPSGLRENLEPLRTLFVHAGRDGERTTISGLLQLSR